MSQAAEKTASAPLITPFEMVGGEAGLRRIVNRFYDIMDTNSAAAELRAMHAPDLAPVRELLFQFMSGWLGGPPLYHQRADRKCIMSAHAAFAIGPTERDQWLMCMRKAMEDVGLSPEIRAYLEEPLYRVADAFRNR